LPTDRILAGSAPQLMLRRPYSEACGKSGYLPMLEGHDPAQNAATAEEDSTMVRKLVLLSTALLVVSMSTEIMARVAVRGPAGGAAVAGPRGVAATGPRRAVGVARPRAAVVRPWVRRPYFGTVVAGVTLGTLIATTTAPPAPSPEVCWAWTSSEHTQGYWDHWQ